MENYKEAKRNDTVGESRDHDDSLLRRKIYSTFQFSSMETLDIGENNDHATSSEQTPHKMDETHSRQRVDGSKKLRESYLNSDVEHVMSLITPKNAMTLLKEMFPHTPIDINVEPVPSCMINQQGMNQQLFCAELAIENVVYQGFSVEYANAINAASEEAFRVIIHKRLHNPMPKNANTTVTGCAPDYIPKVMLSSFALYKLNLIWGYAETYNPSLHSPTSQFEFSYPTVSIPPLSPVSPLSPSLPLSPVSPIASMSGIGTEKSANTMELQEERKPVRKCLSLKRSQSSTGKTLVSNKKKLPLNASKLDPCC